MNTISAGLRTTMGGSAISRRAALRGLGGAGAAAVLAFGFGLPGGVGAIPDPRIARALAGVASNDGPAAVIDAYIGAVNAGDLDAILALYADDAVHIFLPAPDESAGV